MPSPYRDHSAWLTGVDSGYIGMDLVRAALGQTQEPYTGKIAVEPQRLHNKLEHSDAKADGMLRSKAR